MTTTISRQWADPKEIIWGFHVHMETETEDDFKRSLAVQQAFTTFFTEKRGVQIKRSDCIKPGYGPHLGYMWELRMETVAKERVLAELGIAVAFMAVNRLGIPAYIHPTMHNEALPIFDMLKQEGETNQRQSIWFGRRVAQHQDFFFDPPRDPENPEDLLDTRTSRVMSSEEVSRWQREGYALNLKHILNAADWPPNGGFHSGHPTTVLERVTRQGLFRDPNDVIICGFHIHVDFTDETNATGFGDDLFAAFTAFMRTQGIEPSSTRRYGPKENGPHQWGGWEFKLEYRTSDVGPNVTFQQLGMGLGWLMCNRGDEVRVFAHAVSWEDGDFDEELYAHAGYSFFIGDDLPPLDLSFFQNLIDRKAASLQ
jgi:hypothetical protein